MESKEETQSDGLVVLIIDDEPSHVDVVAESLERIGFTCITAIGGEAGAACIENDEPDVILTDLKMADMDGLAVLRKAKQELPDSEVIVMTGYGDVQTAVQAMKAGAANYLQKPLNLTELRTFVEKAAERLHLIRANRELQRQLDEKFGFEGVVGNSVRMNQVITKLKNIAPSQATVLIQGATGTGKELVARAIHNNSPRKKKHFVALNCTALNENLLDDELFGHEAGAFTGADRLRKGVFEHANGGTLFLDEVGDMPLNLQAKLLRVLENQEVFRIGSNDPIKVDVRLLSATNRDLEQAVETGEFRRDLYFRLKVVTLNLPPLRERRGDLPLLVAHFIKEMNQRHGKNVVSVAEPVNKAIRRYDWPGNVRELRNVIESMVVQDLDGVLGVDDLHEGDTPLSMDQGNHQPAADGQLVGRPLHEIERYYIEQTLDVTDGNREEAAHMLGIGERTLYRAIQEWKVQDQIRDALGNANGDVKEAARMLEMDEKALQRKLKKMGTLTQ